MSTFVKQTIAVARKDVRSEIRTRYALNALGMFVVVTVSVMAFSSSGERLSAGVVAGVYWIGMFFTAVTGLGRTFISEEERGTTLLLRLSVPPSPVYFGKLIVNCGISLASNLLLWLLFPLVMPDAPIDSGGAFFLLVIVSSLGFAAALTVIAALIARAGARGALYPVLAFPVILPQVVIGTNAMRRAAGGVELSDLVLDIVLMGVYAVSLVLVGYLLFDFLWKE